MKTDLSSKLVGKTVYTRFMDKVIKTEKFDSKESAALCYWTKVSAFRSVERGPLNFK